MDVLLVVTAVGGGFLLCVVVRLRVIDIKHVIENAAADRLHMLAFRFSLLLFLVRLERWIHRQVLNRVVILVDKCLVLLVLVDIQV